MAATQTAPQARTLTRDCSIEVTSKDAGALRDAGGQARAGMRVAITFLANESWRDRIDTAAQVRSLGFEPVPHIAARFLQSHAQLSDFLGALTERADINRAFVIAGDVETAQGPFSDALAVIESGQLVAHGIKTVGISGYPDGHPGIPDAALWRALLDKRSALAAQGHNVEFVTQFAFDADPILRWIAALRQEGVDDPVRIGVPGPASAKTLLRFAARCGVAASTRVLSKYGFSLGRLIGSTGPGRLLDDLENGLDVTTHGETHLHLYPFGGIAPALDFIARINAGR